MFVTVAWHCLIILSIPLIWPRLTIIYYSTSEKHLAGDQYRREAGVIPALNGIPQIR